MFDELRILIAQGRVIWHPTVADLECGTKEGVLAGFGVKTLPGKGHTVCGLLVDDPTLASMRKARHCLTFLYGVDADAIEAASIWPRDPRKDIRRISNLINVVTEMGTEESNDT